jgi:hypothetical protein
MNREEVITEFGAQTLTKHNFFARRETREDEVGIMGEVPVIVVYRTDERNHREFEFTAATEADALTVFVTKLRTYLALREFVHDKGLT